MKNKKWAGLTLAVIIVVVSICGCVKKDSNTANVSETAADSNTAEIAEDSDTVELTDAAEDSNIVNATVDVDGNDTFEYDYEQELQIIDDNYRNYYEIFVYSFCDSDGDGIGDLNGVTQKLDYIADMGFNGIWLMPVFQSTTYHKYDVTDYYAIDKEYGTTEDFRKLLEECHKRGIRVIIDFVMNHSSSQNQWFIEACDYLQKLPEGQEPDTAACPFVEYYHFAKESQKDFYQVEGTEWYYEGVFWSEMPDLNLESDALRRELEKIAAYWINMGVDGFRMDAAMHFEEKNTEENVSILNWFYQYCLSLNPDFYMVSEVWANETEIAKYYSSKTPSMFNFDVADNEGKLVKAARGTYKAENFVKAMIKYQEDFGKVNPDYIDAPFISNHDMGRVANALRNDEDDLKMACGLLMTMNGNPFVYYGEEIGMVSSGTKDENKRLPFIWSDTDTAGMTKGPKDADTGIVSAFPGAKEQAKDEYSLLNYYKRAIRIRNENPEIARGTIQIIDSLCNGHQAVITKKWDDSVIAVCYNTSDEPIDIVISDTEIAQMRIRGYLTIHGERIELKDGVITMPAQSVCILK